MNYKLSDYCRVYTIDDEIFLYDSRTGLKSYVFDKIMIGQLRMLQQGCTLESSEVHPEFLKLNVVVPEDENEISSVIARSEEILNHNEEELGLIVLTTRNCNFGCIYCYESHNNNRLSQTTAQRLIYAVKDYHKKHPLLKKISVEWFGGEPLLEKKIIYFISDEIIAYCNENNISYSASITSNGYLLDAQTQYNLIDRKVNVFQITVDGPQDIHDRNRPLKNGEGTWNTIIHNLELLKKNEAPYIVRLRTNYSFDTYLRADAFLDDMKKRFDDPRFHFHFMRINAPEGREMPIETIDTEMDKSVIGLNFDVFREHNIDLDVYVLNFNPCGGVCYARRGNVFAIDTDGTILKCTEYLDHPKNCIGTIQDGLFDIDFEKNAAWIHPDPRILVNKGCYECFDFPSCFAGICPAGWVINNQLRCNPYYMYTDTIMHDFLKSKRHL